MKINDQAVVTLPNPWAFVHTCCHAMTDRWSSLRHLVDVERLSRSVGSDCFERGKIPMRSVLKTCCVAAELTEANLVHDIARQASAFQRHKALRMAEVAQRRGWRSLGEGEWTLRNRIRYSLHHLNLSHHPSHWLSMALHHMVPPSALVDGQQGTYRSAWGVLKNRPCSARWGHWHPPLLGASGQAGGDRGPVHGRRHPGHGRSIWPPELRRRACQRRSTAPAVGLRPVPADLASSTGSANCRASGS